MDRVRMTHFGITQLHLLRNHVSIEPIVRVLVTLLLPLALGLTLLMDISTRIGLSLLRKRGHVLVVYIGMEEPLLSLLEIMLIIKGRGNWKRVLSGNRVRIVVSLTVLIARLGRLLMLRQKSQRILALGRWKRWPPVHIHLICYWT
jgi:hypothetical protein